MISVTSKITNREIGGSIGAFSINTANTSAQYVIGIQYPPVNAGPAPSIALNYNSLINMAGPDIAPGWKISGIPILKGIGTNQYFDGTSTVEASRDKQGNLNIYSDKGDTTVFRERVQGDPTDTKSYIATKIADAYGNELLFHYFDQSDQLQSITYGKTAGQEISLQFAYEETNDGNNYLSSITAMVEDVVVRKYQLNHEDGQLESVSVSVWDYKNPEIEHVLDPVIFTWEKTTSSLDLLASITEPSGFKTTINYQSEVAGAVASAEYSVTGIGSKPDTFKTIVNSKNLKSIGKYGYIAEEVKLWNTSDCEGVYYYNDVKSKRPGATLVSGKFSNARGTQSGDGVISFVGAADGQSTSYHYKKNETQTEYFEHKSGLILAKSKTQTSYFDKGQALPPEPIYFEYDDEGRPTKTIRNNITTVTETQEAPEGSNQHLRLMTRTSVYETSGEKALLKDNKYSYEFDSRTGNIQKVTCNSLIEGNKYSLPHVSHIGKLGLSDKVVAPNGSYMTSEFSEDGNTQTKTFYSADGKQSGTETVVMEPVYGMPIRTVSPEGVICEQKYDAFGKIVETKGFDLANPTSWSSIDNLVTLSTSKTGFDRKAKLFYTEMTFPGSTPDEQCVKRIYSDSLLRSVAEANKIGKKRWKVSLVKHETMSHIGATSFPIEIKADDDAIGMHIKAQYTNKSVLWATKHRDDYGRVVQNTFPGGSIEKFDFELDSNKNIVATTTYKGTDGYLKTLQSQTMGPSGITEALNGQDSAPTKFTYDALGQVVSKTDPDGQTTTYKWNALGACIEENNPTMGKTSFQTDTDLLVKQVSANDYNISIGYDGFGRTVSQTITQQGSRVEKTYLTKYDLDADNKSIMVTATHPDGWKTVIRSSPHGQELERQLVLGEAYSEKIANDLDTSGRISARHFPDGRVLQHKYDSEGNIANVDWAHGKPVAIFAGTGPKGQPALSRFGNGVIETRNFDEYGNSKNFIVHNSNNLKLAPYLSVGLQNNDAFDICIGARVAEVDGKVQTAEAYKYDDTLRLVGIQSQTSTKLRKFGGDDVLEEIANNKHPTVFKSSKSRYQIQSITGPQEVDLSYDASGNVHKMVVGEETQDLDFDAFNQLQSITRTVGKQSSTTSFATDAYGQRIVKALPDGTLLITVDDDYQVTMKPDGSVLRTARAAGAFGNFYQSTIQEQKPPTRKLFVEFDKSKSVLDGVSAGAMSGHGIVEVGDVYIHLDDLGSSLAATNGDGQKIATIDFDTGGVILAGSVGKHSFDITYAGMRYEGDTGLYHHDLRYYSPITQRFLSPDPAKTTTDPYAYPTNPVNQVDIEGACGKWWKAYKKAARQYIGRPMGFLAQSISIMVCSLIAAPIIDNFSYYDEDAGHRCVTWSAGDWDEFYAMNNGTMSLMPDENVQDNCYGLLQKFSYGWAWALVIGLWFAPIFFAKGLVVACNKVEGRTRSSCCPDDSIVAKRQRGHCSSDAIFLLKSFVGALVGMASLGPLLAIVVAGPRDWVTDIIRGFVVTFMVAFANDSIARYFISKFKCLSSSLMMRYITQTLSLCAGMLAWQFLDFGLLAVMGAESGDSHDNLADTLWFHKKTFVLTELYLTPFYVGTNLLTCLLPAALPFKCWSQGWQGCCFGSKRPTVEALGSPDYGKMIPICCCSDPFMDDEIQRKVTVSDADRQILVDARGAIELKLYALDQLLQLQLPRQPRINVPINPQPPVHTSIEMQNTHADENKNENENENENESGENKKLLGTKTNKNKEEGDSE